MATSNIKAEIKQTSVSGTTDANGNLKLTHSGGPMRVVLFAWDGNKVFIPFYYNGGWYARVQQTNAAGSAVTNTAVTCNILYL